MSLWRRVCAGLWRLIAWDDCVRKHHIVICEWDGSSVALPVPDVPPFCKECRKLKRWFPARWRIAMPNELTKSDRRFLRATRLRWDEVK